MDPNLDPSVFAQGFRQDVCDQFYVVGQEAKRKGEKPLNPDEIEQQVRLLSELVKSKGLTPNEDTIRKYIECSMAGYHGTSGADEGGSSSWLWFGATVAVVGAALWFGTRK